MTAASAVILSSCKIGKLSSSTASRAFHARRRTIALPPTRPCPVNVRSYDTACVPQGERVGNHGRARRTYRDGVGADIPAVAGEWPARPAVGRPSARHQWDLVEAADRGPLARSAGALRPVEDVLRPVRA